MAFAAGAAEKLVPAVLITLMGIASLAMAAALLKNILRRSIPDQVLP